MSMPTAHQATVVAIRDRAILIEGDPGMGKTMLAHMLIDRGATLVGDDGVLLEARNRVLWAMPHPNTRGLIEIRNVGIITLPTTEAKVALLIELHHDAPRHVEEPEIATRAGIRLPSLRLWPDAPALALRTEMALAVHGLQLQ
jgi:serine kinase of HPr protein (carbohydrate metabolism regulator)